MERDVKDVRPPQDSGRARFQSLEPREERLRLREDREAMQNERMPDEGGIMDLPKEAALELKKLSPGERRIVLEGLQRKLWHLERTSRLSYKYEVCPVCNDIGSTEESPKCGGCYIQIACKHPFEAGFRDDQAIGETYFRNMLAFMMSDEVKPQSLVVGGNWDADGGKRSKIAQEMAELLGADLLNGGKVGDLRKVDITPYRTIVWLASVPNTEEKVYPKKSRGAVLVVSKVMREGYTAADAAERIFAMRGNAVIEIHTEIGYNYEPKEVGRRLRFRLADALNNSWADGPDIGVVCDGIVKLAEWTRESIRLPSKKAHLQSPGIPEHLPRLIELTRLVADQVENEVGKRYFGNVSTRCMKLFPTMRNNSISLFVSPRNVNKKRIAPEDMVYIEQWQGDSPVFYAGDQAPSVDTPIQAELYRRLPKINFMIHGHAFVEGFPTTEEYFPCGDMREVDESEALMRDKVYGIINLKNHGFLAFAEDITELEFILENVRFDR
jgi:hypothetical protein